jgi:hypothetical protein
MARDWFEKNTWWLHWVVKFAVPAAIILSSFLMSYIITYYGIETKSDAAQIFQTKVKSDSLWREQRYDNQEYEKLVIELGIRQKVDRSCIVILNQKHNIPTPDYPLTMPTR